MSPARSLIACLIVWTLTLVGTPAARAATECGQSPAGGTVYRWCIDRDPTRSNPDFLYYMHGGGGSEHGWQEGEYSKELNRLWREHGASAPTVISISFGHQWLLGDVNTPEHPALLPIFLKLAMPALEARLGSHARPLAAPQSGRPRAGRESLVSPPLRLLQL